MLSRDLLRKASAAQLNSLSRDELFDNWRITRIADLTGLDILGIPVFSVCRPEGQTVSVNAGKSLSRDLARAGAIAEGAEFHTFESPAPVPKKKRNYAGINDLAFDWHLLPWSKYAEKSEPFEVELVSRWGAGWTQFPSDLLWLCYPDRAGSNLFQRTTNGQAVGTSFEDAFLSGIYECVERDAVTCWTVAWDEKGKMPPIVNYESVPPKIGALVHQIQSQGLELIVFYCTLDIPVPVFWAVILDPYGGLAPFGGYGCAIESEEAILRAILEAVQSRAVYISGARDDILRRNVEFLQNMDQVEVRNAYRSIPKVNIYFDHTFREPPSAYRELDLLLRRLGDYRKNLFHLTVYTKHLIAVKSVIIGLEQPKNPMWAPSQRATQFLNA